MTIYIGADHRGYELKENLVAWLQEQGYEVADIGAHEINPDDDYPDFGIAVAEAVAEDASNRRGILLCGSGVGMAVVANKIKGVRAALIHDPAIAKEARTDDDSNVLALGASHISEEGAKEVLTAWLDTSFSEEDRHVRRIQKIQEYEA